MPRDEESGSLRDDIEAAYDASSGETPAPEAPAATETPASEPERASEGQPESPESAPAERSERDQRDQKGRFAKKAPEEAAAPHGAAKPPPKGAQGGVTPEPAGATPPATPAFRAPQSWKPAARELWGKLPPEIQAEVSRRERETSATLQEAAEARKHVQQFREIVAPFEGFMRADGVEPMDGIRNLLQTSAALRVSAPGQKAQMIANMVRHFGVPIEMLDAALAGQAAPQGQQSGPQFRDPRVDEIIADRQREIQERKQEAARRDQALIADAERDLETFESTHEFLPDVREQMADLIEIAARRGVVLSKEQAYDQACRLDEGISKILDQRRAAGSAATSSQATQRARQAASSIRSTPTISGAENRGGGSRRDDILEAWEQVESR